MPKEKGFYRAEEIDARGEREVNDPGEYPFTRGLYPEMYRKKKPTIRQFAGHGLAADTNKRFRMLLATGTTGLSTAFDLPTLMGRDSDDPLALGQVGWDGVAVDTLADMEALFSDIAIGEVSVSMTVSGPAAIIWAMYLAMAKKRGVAFHELAGTLQNDILKEYAAQKEWLFPEEHGVRLVTDTILYAAEHVPKWHPVSVSGYHIREAGASAVEEIAFTLADGIEYVRHAVARGADVDSFAPQLSFFFDVHNNFMEEIAKLRAARALWARAMKERFNAKDPRSLWCRIHAQTAGCTLARQEPENNIVRVALQALAAMLGGVQSVHTNSYDEVLCTPTIEAVKRAVRTQQIIQEETGIASFPDALGGSFLLERMTCEMEAAAEAEIEKIEAMGGMLCAIRAGYPQRAIRTSALRYEEAVERGNIRIVGVNIYTEGEERGDPERIAVELAKRRDFEGRQKVSLAEVKRARDGSKVKEALQAVLRVAQTDENLMPALIEAVLAYATVGEIANTLKGVWGEYKERELFPVFS
ncbi:MAG: methylmalonyl-CoA mutase, partial [Parcubacteria group bacterium]|nr:methylmalonyl-CoA mutase [Parcubacteria group bacterium]